MFLEIDLETFRVRQSGFFVRPIGARRLYTSDTLTHLQRIDELVDAEYGQAVEVDREARTVSFGRDFLGHYPLSYACEKGKLYISDRLQPIAEALERAGVRLTVWEEALALYFTMGFIPHGFSTYRQIVNCESSGYYTWAKGSVRRVRRFEPVEVDERAPLDDLGAAIEAEIAACARRAPQIDVWCSGGLDSAIMAVRFNAGGRRADLLTLSYGQEIHDKVGDGERRFAHEVGRFCGAPVREAEMACRRFEQMHEDCLRSHNGPVIDTPVPPKYALAEASRPFVVTGEGGDNFFGGPKNVYMMYAAERWPHAHRGYLYAMAHERFFHKLKWIFVRGAELAGFVEEYCQRLLDAYPGPLLRKIYYLNALEKPSSMIFAQSYLPARRHGLTIRHPLGALGVYRQAFRLPDRRKFVYPVSKIALTELYGAQLPPSIVKRRKRGTLVPRSYYLQHYSPKKFAYDALRSTGVFREPMLQKYARRDMRVERSLQVYGLVTLNLWLNQRRAARAIEPAQMAA
jgi:asparagine synthetase B (glutamine-hydrolysing)